MAFEAYGGNGWLLTTFEQLINWGRKRSPWPLPYGTACCGIEMMAALASGYDMARFGAERPSFSPRQADVLIEAGTITKKMVPVLKKIYDQMAEPKWVIAMGACACSGGVFRTYSTLQGIDNVIPVDVYIPGCPPRPEALLQALLELHEKIDRDRPLRGGAARAAQGG
ncbi:NADH-quinone oxidoreductase subunit B [Dissulfurirhabdus thermomarina]|uniref:NADH-quinone oxidoreductase subunit B n=1 Tax=Dissulfurirhabdus thermomarina TaxID=1765737 RepID=A0A6N9TSE3_DISTH|nr:NADH-quinone oxidoreductase subunit NuoB [Dissulfurirhabdus thermomarina]NDY41476.1 NADH-quinone oxidoreductase subunit B [Dissulfurirhabdus thermomarina]NMX24242.1 NADH-quinone oxidoreductase subunit NuoB [Dissulfurirhabdus thermomarina]